MSKETTDLKAKPDLETLQRKEVEQGLVCPDCHEYCCDCECPAISAFEKSPKQEDQEGGEGETRPFCSINFMDRNFKLHARLEITKMKFARANRVEYDDWVAFKGLSPLIETLYDKETPIPYKGCVALGDSKGVTVCVCGGYTLPVIAIVSQAPKNKIIFNTDEEMKVEHQALKDFANLPSKITGLLIGILPCRQQGEWVILADFVKLDKLYSIHRDHETGIFDTYRLDNFTAFQSKRAGASWLNDKLLHQRYIIREPPRLIKSQELSLANIGQATFNFRHVFDHEHYTWQGMTFGKPNKAQVMNSFSVFGYNYPCPIQIQESGSFDLIVKINDQDFSFSFDYDLKSHQGPIALLDSPNRLIKIQIKFTRGDEYDTPFNSSGKAKLCKCSNIFLYYKRGLVLAASDSAAAVTGASTTTTTTTTTSTTTSTTTITP